DRLAVGVVKMSGQGVDRDHLGDGGDQPGGPAGRARAYGVAERYFVAAHRMQRRRDVAHGRWRDLALVRAVEHAGNVAAPPPPFGLGRGGDRTRTLEAFADRAIDV